ncbi:MAG: dTDP-4-dehydrorhamnose reductase, partial [Halobacteriaceae archaeon]
MKILVIGGSGLAGSNIVTEAARRGHGIDSTYLNNPDPQTGHQLDKTNSDRVNTIVEETDPDVIIDTAAFHNVDDCESKRNHAFSVNVEGTSNVAKAANQLGAHYIYLSSDYVFPGNASESPYAEDDPVFPPNYYAQTKLAGEQAAKIPEHWTVLRPSVIYGTKSENFVTWALGELRSGNEISIVNDQVSRPTYAPDLARACIEIGEKNLTGLYHSTGPSSLNRFEFTKQLAKSFDLDDDLVKPITTEEFGQEAPRPTDSSLSSSKLYKDLGWEFKEPVVAFDDM